MQLRDGGEACFDLRLIEQRPQKVGAQQTLAHRRLAAVEGVEEGGAGGGVGEQRLDELEIANADRIELQMLGALVVAQAIDVRKIACLRGADVVQRCAGGDGGGGMAREAEAVERARLQLPLEEREWRSRR